MGTRSVPQCPKAVPPLEAVLLRLADSVRRLVPSVRPALAAAVAAVSSRARGGRLDKELRLLASSTEKVI